ncbi:MAG TPA: 6,7-dimethyl-8-ribityllumazine synthase [Bacteroidales bacterium]|nr:6,7-dimethyl-8-ribityllumazine synthase [Bacteroidales bacterium]HOE04419.1 6,7-dimethyl-8-ribityllumazine synthase [Bacteroidales bacterium]
MSSKLNNLSFINSTNLPSGEQWRVGIAVSEWNNDITSKLLDGAITALLQSKVQEDSIKVVYVPGSYELPVAAQWLIEAYGCDSVLCLGCVIQGETRHFDFICESVSRGIMDLNLKHNIPVIFGVLTTNNLQQAYERAGGTYGNKGIEAAHAALKMMALKAKCNL